MRRESPLSKLVLMDEGSFVVSDESGEIGRDDPADGLYHHDTRYLSAYRLTLNGQPLAFLSTPLNDSTSCVVMLTNDTLTLPDGTMVLPQTISLRRTRFLRHGMHERLELVSYCRVPIPFRLELNLAADFRDMFDIRGIASAPNGELLEPVLRRDSATLRYLGRDRVSRTTAIICNPAFDEVEMVTAGDQEVQSPVSLPDAAHFVEPHPRASHQVRLILRGTLEPQVPYVASLFVQPREEETDSEVVTFDVGMERERAQQLAWSERETTRVLCSSDALTRLLNRSAADLFMLTRWPESGPVPVAGIPWFAVPFGRDSLITSLEALMLAPDLAVGTLRFLAMHQAAGDDPWRDAEPGKIMHELRAGEFARVGAIPHTPYYGSVDSTPLFLVLLSEVMRWLDDDALLEELWPAAERALEWIDRHGDLDGDGLVEYQVRSPIGIWNQGWKDSNDSVTHAEGRLAEPPIALIEVQAYVYAAWRGAAELCRRRGDAEGARMVEQAAERLRNQVHEQFWLPDQRMFAEALDRDKRPVAVPTSNAAHAFYCGLAHDCEAEAMAARLAEPDMLSGWGLRTLSSRATSYNPMSYHNGSVWPHDNAIAVAGLFRYGQDPLAIEIFQQVFTSAQGFRGYRLPELYCGFPRTDPTIKVPAAYPVSCSPQSWAAAAPYLMLQAMLGLEPDAANARLRLRPRLPDWLEWIELQNLRVGRSRVGFRVARRDDHYVLDVTSRNGSCEVALS